ncbi:MAG: inorganic phosphate transporter [Nitrospirae bacterium GWC2_56_14]|nr:MAG: inorganic phosphate transporter [Nitrospirae bacterium GWC2_56_14]
MPEILILIIVLAVLFDIANGWHDCANAIATVVSTKVLSPGAAVAIAAFMNILGAFLTTAVAKTIGTGIVDPAGITDQVIIAALLSAIIWNLITILMGLPVSSSHALVGGLIGAAAAHGGISILNSDGIMKIFTSLLISPLFGFVIGYAFMKLILFLFGHLSPGTISKYFGRLQIVSSSFMAFGHGSNDAQKAMGIITMALFASGKITTLDVPTWVVITCALAMGFGTIFGGWKIIKTLGVKMLKLEPIHGFAAETSSAGIIMAASYFGMPVSTTHVVSTAILGVGATKRLSAVRWGIAGKIVMAWLLTLPFCIALAWGIEKALTAYHIGG